MDVRIFSSEYKAADLAVGDSIAFQVEVSTKNADKRRQHPWATGVRRLGGSHVDAQRRQRVLPGRVAKGDQSDRSAVKLGLNTGASEFVPACQQQSGRRLDSSAAEF